MITFQKLCRKTPRTPNLQSALWGVGYVIPGSLLTGQGSGKTNSGFSLLRAVGCQDGAVAGSTSTKDASLKNHLASV